MIRKLQGKEKVWAGRTLTMLKDYGVTSIQIGNKVLSKKGDSVFEKDTLRKKKPKK